MSYQRPRRLPGPLHPLHAEGRRCERLLAQEEILRAGGWCAAETSSSAIRHCFSALGMGLLSSLGESPVRVSWPLGNVSLFVTLLPCGSSAALLAILAGVCAPALSAPPQQEPSSPARHVPLPARRGATHVPVATYFSRWLQPSPGCPVHGQLAHRQRFIPSVVPPLEKLGTERVESGLRCRWHGHVVFPLCRFQCAIWKG